MSFNPKFTITNKILNNITMIISARDVIEQSGIVPRRELKLRRQAILHNTHSSTAIEGNKLTLEQVEDLANGKNVLSTDKDKKEVLNYLEALDKLPLIAKKGSIKMEELLFMHKMLTSGTLQHEKNCGSFRDRQVFVGRRIFDGTGFSEEVEYMPPATAEVPGLIHEFIKWLNSDTAWEINPVILAGIVHYEIARIHPFIDGNGRTARLLATLMLYLSGFDHRRLFALDDFYNQDRKAYYSALKTAQSSNGDITDWLEYFTKGVAFSVNEVKEAILKLGFKKKRLETAQISLTERQMKIVEFVNRNKRITNRNVRDMFEISNRGALDEINKLLKLKVLQAKGKGRSQHYILVP